MCTLLGFPSVQGISHMASCVSRRLNATNTPGSMLDKHIKRWLIIQPMFDTCLWFPKMTCQHRCSEIVQHKTFEQRDPTPSTLVQHCTNVIQICFVYRHSIRGFLWIYLAYQLIVMSIIFYGWNKTSDQYKRLKYAVHEVVGQMSTENSISNNNHCINFGITSSVLKKCCF